VGEGHRLELRSLLVAPVSIHIGGNILHTRPPAPNMSGMATSAPSLSVLVLVIVVVVERELNSVTVD
jgi:hypothetical protein